MSPAIRGNDYAKGNDGGGAPPGNHNAVGNDGGAPKGNWNAAKHHGWSDPLKHYHRLAGEPRKSADEHIEGNREMYARYHGLNIGDVEQHIAANQDFEDEEAVRDAFRELAAMLDQRMRADGPVAKEGFLVQREIEFEDADGETHTYTKDVVNPAIEAGLRLSSKRHTLEKDLGLIEDGKYLFVWSD